MVVFTSYWHPPEIREYEAVYYDKLKFVYVARPSGGGFLKVRAGYVAARRDDLWQFREGYAVRSDAWPDLRKLLSMLPYPPSTVADKAYESL